MLIKEEKLKRVQANTKAEVKNNTNRERDVKTDTEKVKKRGKEERQTWTDSRGAVVWAQRSFATR